MAVTSPDDLRREITLTDREILALLNRRARLCREVGRVKSASDQAVFNGGTDGGEREQKMLVGAAVLTF